MLLISNSKKGNAKQLYWKTASPITVTGYFDDVVVLCTYKNGYINKSRAFCVIEFVDTKGNKQYEMRATTSIPIAKSNLGNPIEFQYIEDGYMDKLPQLDLSNGIFRGTYVESLVGITEDKAKADAKVITLRSRLQPTGWTYKVYSVKYSSTPRDYPPSILCNKNSRLRIPGQPI